MARAHDENTQPIYEAAYRAYESGGYIEVVDAVAPLLIEQGRRQAVEDIRVTWCGRLLYPRPPRDIADAAEETT